MAALVDAVLVERLYRQADAGRWRVAVDVFAAALQSSAERAFPGQYPTPKDVERYLNGLHLQDLALACACASGDDQAWDHFVLEQRPLLYRAATALDPGGGARDLADSLYAELFGLRERDGKRDSLFRYFHGRSSLSTWLRAVLSQRYVDRMRSARGIEQLPDEERSPALIAPGSTHDPDRQRYLPLIQRALQRALANLQPRDRLRLACYYAEEMTLAETGRLLGEHEATSSRHLARTRRSIREDVERQLRSDHGLAEAEIQRCFECVLDDVGTLDVRILLEREAGRKESALDRSS